MSYDLSFYKKKDSSLNTKKISDYLTKYLGPESIDDSKTHWFFINKETENYFDLDLNDPITEPEEIEFLDNFENYKYTDFTFNLNYLRPDFFGVEAFKFIDRFIADLDLFVLNPQSNVDADNPTKPQSGDLYQNWSEINAKHSAHFFKEYNLDYLPWDKSNYVYEYKLNRNNLQQALGDNYYVSQIYVFKNKADGNLFILSLWPENLPVIIPKADFYLLTKTIKDTRTGEQLSGIISSKMLDERFGNMFEDYSFPDTKIIHPPKAAEVQKLFNATTFEYDLKDYGIGVPLDRIVNVKSD